MSSYRLVSYQAPKGPRAGIVVDETVFDAEGLTGNGCYATVLGILAQWTRAHRAFKQAIAKNGGGEAFTLSSTKLLAPVLWPSAIYCAGTNYSDHMLEMARAANIEPDPDPHRVGLKPWHFIKASRTVAGHGDKVALPAGSRMVDWEAELVAVIGRPAKNISIRKALDHVAGYTVANDLSARDLSSRALVPETSPFKLDWLGQKNFDGACPIGPWIVPAEDIADPQNLGIKLWVNDVIKQDSHTGRMIFTLAEQISYLSSRLTLHPGDLVLTGTPAGVGLARREFLKAGDIVKISIENVGTLTNTMA